MRIGVKVAKNDERFFVDYDEAMDYIESFMTEIESLNISTDDIIINYYDGKEES